MHSVTILGATGYTGRELVRILIEHPKIAIDHVTSTTRAGLALDEVHPELRGRAHLVLEAYDASAAAESDVVVSCLPHKESMTILAGLARDHPDVKLVDLSADFRFQDATVYEHAYGTAHVDAALAREAAYGLPELFRDAIPDARLVANPGCYPTSALIATAPLARAGLLEDVIVDAKSGLSGAGATPGPITHFAKANESVAPYKLYSHRHAPEISTHLAALAGGDVPLTFTPHLVPMDRGILSTVYVRFTRALTADALRDAFEDAYGKEPFVRILPEGAIPDTKHTTMSNFVDVGFALAPGGRRATIVSALDNLVKGASGQAVQNLNLLLGLPETLGLLSPPKDPKKKVVA